MKKNTIILAAAVAGILAGFTGTSFAEDGAAVTPAPVAGGEKAACKAKDGCKATKGEKDKCKAEKCEKCEKPACEKADKAEKAGCNSKDGCKAKDEKKTDAAK